jgi:hypothetical protein
LAETGWAALGAQVRGQTFILHVPSGYKFEVPGWTGIIPPAQKYAHMLDDYAGRTRYLVNQHARQFQGKINGLYVCNTIEDVVKALKQKYGK